MERSTRTQKDEKEKSLLRIYGEACAHFFFFMMQTYFFLVVLLLCCFVVIACWRIFDCDVEKKSVMLVRYAAIFVSFISDGHMVESIIISNLRQTQKKNVDTHNAKNESKEESGI